MASKKLQYAIGNSASTTLSVAASNADTTLTITSDTNFAAKSGEGMVIIDEGEDTEELAYASSKSGSALSVTLANRGLEGGSAQSHAINSTIKGVLTAGMWNDMIDSVANILDSTAGTVKSFNMPTAGSVNDANGNELIKFPAVVSSATNEITISNAANGSSPSIAATGSSDSNVGIILTPKGTGDININSATANIQIAGADPKRGIYVPASAMYGATTSGAASGQIETSSNKVNVKVLDFDKDADESAHFAIPSPLYWDASTVTVTPYWTTTAGTTGTVVWSIQAMSFANDDALDQAYGTAQTSTDTFILASDLHIAPTTSAITVGGSPTAGDWIQFKILRDVSEDTLDNDARLLGVRVTFGIAKYTDE